MEGKTEKAFFPVLRSFLENRLPGRMPKLNAQICNGRLPTRDRLKRDVERHLLKSDAVIALTDVYTGSPDFIDATDAKSKMRNWVGPNNRFHPHAAQYDFEAWLLPFWSDIQRVSGSNRGCPHGLPELVNHNKPPSKHIQEAFQTGSNGRSYLKTRDAAAILKNANLEIAAAACPELKAFLNTILKLSEGELL